MTIRHIVLGLLVVGVSFVGATLLMNFLWPSSATHGRPALVAVPPLQPLSRTSTVVAPAAIAISAIRESMEAQAPRHLAGKRDNPISPVLANADITWTIARGPLALTGRPDLLTITTPLSGTFQARGQISGQVGALAGALGSIVGGDVGQQVQSLTGKAFDQRGDVRGTVTMTSRPSLAPNWRLAPNLAAQVQVADVAVPVGGIRISVAKEVKPFLDNALREQTVALEARVRADPFLEHAARGEWTKLCRSIPLAAAGAGLPNLWLEVRPTRAFATQPQIDANAVNLLLGVQAETRIVTAETRPTCPFPAQLEIVSQATQGRVSIGVPIDLPFTDVSRLLDAQLKGRTFPEDGSGSFSTTIQQAAIAASGDRLLISLLVKVRQKSFFSLGAEATVHVWGRPVLDQAEQIVRFADIEVDVQSAAAFGLIGAAAKSAIPYLRNALAERASIDLKPFAANAKARIAAAVADFSKPAAGVKANVAVNELRLVGIAFDAMTLRVIADAEGTVNVAVTSLAVP
jgi:hypothetical protein